MENSSLYNLYMKLPQLSFALDDVGDAAIMMDRNAHIC